MPLAPPLAEMLRNVEARCAPMIELRDRQRRASGRRDGVDDGGAAPQSVVSQTCDRRDADDENPKLLDGVSDMPPRNVIVAASLLFSVDALATSRLAVTKPLSVTLPPVIENLHRARARPVTLIVPS